MKATKLSASIWVRLAKCYSLILREVQRGEDELGLTVPQFDVLSQLLRNPDGMTPGSLSRALLVTAGNVTGIVARLEAQGLVERTDHPSDGRVAILKLTALGKRRAAAGVEWHEKRIADVLGRLASADQTRIRDSLDVLRDALEPMATSASAQRSN